MTRKKTLEVGLPQRNHTTLLSHNVYLSLDTITIIQDIHLYLVLYLHNGNNHNYGNYNRGK